nr:hypothetical protein Itr_chr02CG12860 [Ipomoea trifida]
MNMDLNETPSLENEGMEHIELPPPVYVVVQDSRRYGAWMLVLANNQVLGEGGSDPAGKGKATLETGESSKTKSKPPKHPPQNRQPPTIEWTTTSRASGCQVPKAHEKSHGGSQVSSRGRAKFSSKDGFAGFSEGPNVTDWRGHFDY